MFGSLRTHLLIANMTLLVVSVCGLIIAFFVASSTQTAPPQPTYQRLSALAQGLNLQDLMTEFGNLNRGGRIPTDYDLIESFAETRDVRVLVVNVARSILLFDSANNETDSPGILRLEQDNDYQPSYRQGNPNNRQLVFGRFYDSEGEWLFAGFAGNNQVAFIIADLRPTQSLRAVLAEFGSAWARPTMIAGGISVLIAVVLSWLMSRTIARPLQTLGDAANAVAAGNLGYQVPMRGPREFRAAAEAFNTMSAEVRATQQAQRDFMANVTHDLKTPLTSIQGYSQAIIDGAAKDPRTAAEIIHDEATRLNRMVADLTDLARMQAGQLPMHMEPIDLRPVVETVAQKLAVVAQKQQIQLITHTEPVPLMIGDGDQIVQILNNLIGNAIKYTPAGGYVRVYTRMAQDGIELIVADTGIGIPERELARIFERFYQVDKARGPARGTGLGLAITNEIVQAHKGRITVQSAPGQGTSFTVWFPAFHLS